MIKHTQNNQGITLVELLLAISILSLIGVLIWSVFFQGMEYSHRSITKNQMQQELNIMMMKLTRIHQTSSLYELISENDRITVTFTDEDGTSTEVFEDSRFKFKATTDQKNPIYPNKKNTLVELTITDKNNSDRKIEAKISLSRLKE